MVQSVDKAKAGRAKDRHDCDAHRKAVRHRATAQSFGEDVDKDKRAGNGKWEQVPPKDVFQEPYLMINLMQRAGGTFPGRISERALFAVLEGAIQNQEEAHA